MRLRDLEEKIEITNLFCVSAVESIEINLKLMFNIISHCFRF
jgi:hypothetical protein